MPQHKPTNKTCARSHWAKSTEQLKARHFHWVHARKAKVQHLAAVHDVELENQWPSLLSQISSPKQIGLANSPRNKMGWSKGQQRQRQLRRGLRIWRPVAKKVALIVPSLPKNGRTTI